MGMSMVSVSEQRDLVLRGGWTGTQGPDHAQKSGFYQEDGGGLPEDL